MSYQVLARKWRPRSFPEMVGQEHVLRALINALDHDRLHHAFLFTGTRGVGKTTVARILAKSLNCEQGVGSRPCGQCSACREIDEGRFVDLIEVDAASRTKVEDTRELLDNVQYAPTRGRYKVYLIDEVHMLSNHSFNALLKTLEEPPPHIKFLLATTDPQKLPITILSRCLQFSLKRLAVEQIRPHLTRILEQEQIPAEPEAIGEIARAADGSMRDALSLLDQAIAFGAGRLSAPEVREMLGTVDRGRVFALLDALAAGDGARLLAEAQALAERSPDFGALLLAVNSALHRVALGQTVPAALGEEEGDRETVLRLAGRFSPEEVQLCYQIGVMGSRDLPFAPDPRTGFEMALLRMLAFRPVSGEPSERGRGSGQAAVGAAPSGRQSAPAGAAEPLQAPAETAPRVAPVEGAARCEARQPPEPAIEARPEPGPPADPHDLPHDKASSAPPWEAAPAAGGAEPPEHPFLGVSEPPPPPFLVTAPATAISAPPPAVAAPPLPAAAMVADDDSGLPGEAAGWCALVRGLTLSGMTRQFADHCAFEARGGTTLRLRLDSAFQHLMTPKWREALEKALAERLGHAIKLEVRLGEGPGFTPRQLQQKADEERQRAAEASIEADPHVRHLLERFNAQIEPGSIRPLA